jgi:hypothetical protein
MYALSSLLVDILKKIVIISTCGRTLYAIMATRNSIFFGSTVFLNEKKVITLSSIGI